MNSNPIIKNINITIFEKGLKKQAVAERMGVTPQQFSDMLNGRRIIKADDVLSICIALDVTPNKLFGYNKTA